MIHLYKRGGPGRAENPDTDTREFGLITGEKWDGAQDVFLLKVTSLRGPAAWKKCRQIHPIKPKEETITVKKK